MHSIRTKLMLTILLAIVISLTVITLIGVFSIKNLGRNDSDQMIHLTATTGAMNLEQYFESVEHSVETVSTLVNDSLTDMLYEDLENQVERARNLFGRVAHNTNGVLTYYFRIDPEISKDIKGFWYVYEESKGFTEHEVTDITQYDTNDTSVLVWFTVPKATGEGVWLPPYHTENLGARVVSYNVPVYWKNTFVGVIGIEIDYKILAEEVQNIRVFKTGYAFILDEDSNVIYHPELGSERLDLSIDPVDSADEHIGSNHVAYKFDGVNKEAVWIPLSNGMRLFVAAPVSEINSAWIEMIWIILIASVIILALVSIATLRFAEHLAKPLTDLTEAARQVDKGNYDLSLDYAKEDEIGLLTRTFRQLADNTKEKITAATNKAEIDPLTGIKNKLAYEELEAEIDVKIAKGEQEPFAVVVCDINNLKAVNDLYGHSEGDDCIRKSSSRISAVFSHSPVFRIGGDEFAVILTGEGYEQRSELVEKINTLPQDLSDIRAGETVSAGMAEFDKDRHSSLRSVFEDADKAMYERKRKSRPAPTV